MVRILSLSLLFGCSSSGLSGPELLEGEGGPRADGEQVRLRFPRQLPANGKTYVPVLADVAPGLPYDSFTLETDDPRVQIDWALSTISSDSEEDGWQVWATARWILYPCDASLDESCLGEVEIRAVDKATGLVLDSATVELVEPTEGNVRAAACNMEGNVVSFIALMAPFQPNMGVTNRPVAYSNVAITPPYSWESYGDTQNLRVELGHTKSLSIDHWEFGWGSPVPFQIDGAAWTSATWGGHLVPDTGEANLIAHELELDGEGDEAVVRSMFFSWEPEMTRWYPEHRDDQDWRRHGMPGCLKYDEANPVLDVPFDPADDEFPDRREDALHLAVNEEAVVLEGELHRGDHEWFRLEIGETVGTLTIAVEADGFNASGQVVAVETYGFSARGVASADSWRNGGLQFEVIEATNAYYVEVYGYSWNDQGSYTLTAAFEPLVPQPPVLYDDHGEDPTTATVLDVASGLAQTTGTLDAGDLDVFELHVEETGVLHVWTDLTTHTHGTLRDADGNTLSVGYTNVAQGWPLNLTPTVEPGTYYLAIRGTLTTTTGDYTVFADLE